MPGYVLVGIACGWSAVVRADAVGDGTAAENVLLRELRETVRAQSLQLAEQAQRLQKLESLMLGSTAPGSEKAVKATTVSVSPLGEASPGSTGRRLSHSVGNSGGDTATCCRWTPSGACGTLDPALKQKCTRLHEYLEAKTTTHEFANLTTCLGPDSSSYSHSFDGHAGNISLSYGSAVVTSVKTPLKVTHAANCANVAPQLTVQMDTMIDGDTVIDGTLTCSGQLSVADVMTAGGTGLDAVGGGLKHAHELAVASLWTTRTGCTPLSCSLDLASTSSNLKGFLGGFAHGTYGYFVPRYNGAAHGNVARVDLTDFSTSGVSFLDLSTVNANLKGFHGGFTDGTYGYFVPYYNGAQHGNVARIDLTDFSTSGVSFLDLTTVNANLKGFNGGFTDGKYGYFVPWYYGAYHGNVARVDLSDFSTSGVSYLDLTTVNANLKGFRGGFTDGTYGYFVPRENDGGDHGNLARIDLSDFSTSGVSYLNLSTVNANLKGFHGGFTDGTYGYFVPRAIDGAAHGNVARVDLTDFSTSGVSYLDLTTVNSNLKGFVGGFTDGTHGYFVPRDNGADHGNVARVDLSDFSASGVSYLDLTTVDASLKGFSGGFTDGTHGYLVPYRNDGVYHGNVVRLAVSSHTPGIGWASSV